MNSKEIKKIFISHHHSQAKELAVLKKELKKIGIEAFLAHEDIEPSEHDLERIEEELRDCDKFLYVCSKKSNESFFCQQEIGMAKALNKEIISVKTEKEIKDGEEQDILPKGFIARQQAEKVRDLNDIYFLFLEDTPVDEEVESHLKMLNCEGFSKQKREGYIYFKKKDYRESYASSEDYYNDKINNHYERHDYFTTYVEIFLNETLLGGANIVFNGKGIGKSSLERLPMVFHCFDGNFFSRIHYEERVLAQEQRKSISFLLRDFSFLELEERKKIYDSNKDVLENLIFVYDKEELGYLVHDFSQFGGAPSIDDEAPF